MDGPADYITQNKLYHHLLWKITWHTGHGAFEFSMLQIMGETAPFNILHGCRYLVLDAKHLGHPSVTMLLLTMFPCR